MNSTTVVTLVFSIGGILLFLGVPVGPLLAFSAMAGLFLLTGSITAATGVTLVMSFDIASSITYVVIPMFILMGALASHTGIVRELFDAAYKAVGRFSGGLAVATCLASAAFGAVTGSSISSASAMTRVALPEMRKYGYSIRLSTGIIAASGTFAMMLPPSLIMVFYGIVAQQSIGKLLVAGILPGLLSVVVFSVVILVRAHLNPSIAPKGPSFPFRDVAISSARASPFIVVLLVLIGGILLGIWTPTEASAAGVMVVAIIGFSKRTLTMKRFFSATLDAVIVSAAVLLLVMGSILFGRFLALSGVTAGVAQVIIAAELTSFQLFVALLAFYIILGTFLEGISILALTVPIVLPIIVATGWDPIWFGVILVKLVEIGAITPPVGLNLYAVKSVAPSVNTSDIIRGTVQFWMADIVVLFILYFLPGIVMFLPSFI